LSYRALLRWLVAATAAIWGLGQVAPAHAARVLVLGRDGHVSIENQPLPFSVTPTPLGARTARAIPHTTHADVLVALHRLEQRGAISNASYSHYAASMRAALAALPHLSGTRATELGAVIGILRQVTAEGMLTAGRLPALFLTLDRNRQWWTTGPLPGSGQLINFGGSQINWEYYAGQGIQIQQLSSFGKASYLMSHGPRGYKQGASLLAELIPLASRRAGGLTWEYYFNFDGGAPPWTSAMSQGTALQALAHAYQATGKGSYLLTAQQALPVFTSGPSRGVAVKTSRGIRFIQYTFDPARSDEVINAFLQTLIGLNTYAQASGNQLAWRLFNAGNAEAKHELPSFDTGSWSLYQPGVADTISYHQLVTGFVEQLCSLTHAHVYCTTAAHFQAYLAHPPG
jgi:hypothetical protein